MDYIDYDDINQLMNTTAVHHVVKPTVFAVGTIWLARAFVYVVLAIRLAIKVYLIPNFIPIDLKRKYGKYVVITNIMDPVSQEFAKAFAKKGHSLILTTVKSDNFDKFKSELEKILEENGSKLNVIYKDISKSDDEIYSEIEKQIETPEVKGEIGILINNAGIIGKQAGNFLQYSRQFVLKMTHCHVTDFLIITKIVLKVMVENQRGLIVNVTSPRNYHPYSQSGFPRSMRQFIDEFTKIIGAEFSEYSNLQIEELNPGTIVTENEKTDGTLYPTAAEFVESAMPKIGRVQKTSGFWLHGLYDTLMALIPNIIHQIVYDAIKSLQNQSPKDDYISIPDSVEFN